MFVSVSGGYIPDFHQEVDLLPPSVRIVILHVATNDLASQDPQPVRQHYVDLLRHIQTRPSIELVFCSHVLPRIISRHLHFPNRHFHGCLQPPSRNLQPAADGHLHLRRSTHHEPESQGADPMPTAADPETSRSLGAGFTLANARGGYTDAAHGGPA
ncbi:unnamed protein product [Ixodes persulcatus]